MKIQGVLALCAIGAIAVGITLLFYGARRRPPNWRSMSWGELARTPGTHEGVLIGGMILLVAGGATLSILRFLFG